MVNELQAIKVLFKNFRNLEPDHIELLPSSGSYRQYYRIKSRNGSYIAAYNKDKKENIAFLGFTKTFLKLGLKVPQIYAENIENNVYLLQDIGDTTLLKYLSGNDLKKNPATGNIDIYKKVIEHLPLFQIGGGKEIDYSICYPRNAFDKQSMMWDLNYFKYYFLKLAKVPFDEQHLENDFQTFSNFLLGADCNFFLYRDFQSRNVMIVNDEPYFIDYQGGRRGALQYDIASILFEAKTALDSETREILLDHYLQTLSKHTKIDEKIFLKYYYGYVYIRLMQAMGAYGFRGLYEKKELFLQSIPKAIEHLKWLRTNVKLPVSLPELEKVWDSMVTSEHVKHLSPEKINVTVSINSFSYRKGIPNDETSNGGGFVFDCRLLNNPGKLDKFKSLTGLDLPVIEYLDEDPKVAVFLESVFNIIDQTVEAYDFKDYTNLMVNFGCTGGQHRSVYAAEKLAAHLSKKYTGMNINLRHGELEM
jgi:aminoglycoside/choline kinase family phosphotransferase